MRQSISPVIATVERAIALVLHDLETIQNPYAVLFKGMVHPDESGSSSWYQVRVRGRTRTILICYEGPDVLINAESAGHFIPGCSEAQSKL